MPDASAACDPKTTVTANVTVQRLITTSLDPDLECSAMDASLWPSAAFRSAQRVALDGRCRPTRWLANGWLSGIM
jgi:hypothetical protein